jgi:hypothetical protein
MKPIAILHYHSLLAAALVSGTLGIAGTAIAAGEYSGQAKQPGATTTAPTADAGKATMPGATDAVKAIAPSRSETSDAAFKKLDATGRGYVTKEEAQSLSGFDKAFQDNDANNDGRLSADEFKKAWAAYSGNKG